MIRTVNKLTSKGKLVYEFAASYIAGGRIRVEHTSKIPCYLRPALLSAAFFAPVSYHPLLLSKYYYCKYAAGRSTRTSTRRSNGFLIRA